MFRSAAFVFCTREECARGCWRGIPQRNRFSGRIIFLWFFCCARQNVYCFQWSSRRGNCYYQLRRRFMMQQKLLIIRFLMLPSARMGLTEINDIINDERWRVNLFSNPHLIQSPPFHSFLFSNMVSSLITSSLWELRRSQQARENST